MMQPELRAFDVFGIAGDFGDILREIDWTQTSVGAPQEWPWSLRVYLAMILERPSPTFIYWGEEFTQFYNLHSIELLGERHPAALGAPFEEPWPEANCLVRPGLQKVMAHGEVQVEDRRLLWRIRNGRIEESYYRCTFSPLRDDRGEIAGVLHTVIEQTNIVLTERRLVVFRRLNESTSNAIAHSFAAFADCKLDMPFGLLFLWEEDSDRLGLAAKFGFEEELSAESTPGVTKSRWSETDFEPLRNMAEKACDNHEALTVESLSEVLPRAHLGPWGIPTESARVIPMPPSPTATSRTEVERVGRSPGAMVFGLSPRLGFGDEYKEFLTACTAEFSEQLNAQRAAKLERQLIQSERAARRESEQQRKSLVELLTQAPVPMVVMRGPNLMVELANRAACRLYRFNPEEIIGLSIFELIPSLLGTHLEDILRRVFATGDVVYRREEPLEVIGPDGRMQIRYFSIVDSPLRRSDGQVNGVLAVAFDVTDRVQAREEIDALRKAAEAANRAKDEFLAVVGHELRNPLAPIIMALELMDMRGGEEFRAERDIIARQAKHMGRLVDDLLDVSRITRGVVELNRTRVDIVEALDWAIELSRPLIEQHRHRLIVDAPPGELFVNADPARLAQVFSNLLTNAAKYTPDNGAITVRAERLDDQIAVAVHDTGIGLSADVLPKIFDAFVQDKQTIDHAHGGLGLGLAIVHNLVELHGGSVHAASPGPGKGSEFTVCLPAIE
jgi:PAS domain S-box-containing protein